MDEERVLLNHFISKLFETFPRYPHGKINYRSVQIFAASYVKRFFITRSVLQYNPKTICAAAFLLAVKVSLLTPADAKADDYTPIDADTLGGLFSEATADIIEAEQKLMYGIHYEIYIHTPYRICRVEFFRSFHPGLGRRAPRAVENRGLFLGADRSVFAANRQVGRFDSDVSLPNGFRPAFRPVAAESLRVSFRIEKR